MPRRHWMSLINSQWRFCVHSVSFPADCVVVRLFSLVWCSLDLFISLGQRFKFRLALPTSFWVSTGQAISRGLRFAIRVNLLKILSLLCVDFVWRGLGWEWNWGYSHCKISPCIGWMFVLTLILPLLAGFTKWRAVFQVGCLWALRSIKVGICLDLILAIYWIILVWM